MKSTTTDKIKEKSLPNQSLDKYYKSRIHASSIIVIRPLSDQEKL